jgi:hypothetical protein
LFGIGPPIWRSRLWFGFFLCLAQLACGEAAGLPAVLRAAAAALLGACGCVQPLDSNSISAQLHIWCQTKSRRWFQSWLCSGKLRQKHSWGVIRVIGDECFVLPALWYWPACSTFGPCPSMCNVAVVSVAVVQACLLSLVGCAGHCAAEEVCPCHNKSLATALGKPRWTRSVNHLRKPDSCLRRPLMVMRLTHVP